MKRREFIKVMTLGGGMMVVGNAGSSFAGGSTEKGAGQAAQSPNRLYNSTGRFSHDQLIGYAKKYGTPVYVYDGDLIRERFQKFHSAFKKHYPKVNVHYAMKANTNLSIVGLLKKAGAAAECISSGEIEIALKLGFPGKDILFTASSKSPEELELAVEKDVVINLDSISDLKNLDAVTRRLKKRARISFRMNPDVDPKTHRHISTGHKFSKFGILLEGDEVVHAYKTAKESPYLDVWGLHSHIGSQILDLEPFHRNVQLLAIAVKQLKKELGIELKFVDLGGGLGIPYQDEQAALEPETMAADICPIFQKEMKEAGYLPELWLEPGRYFVAESGILVSRVNSIKETPYQNFINVDTGFNHLVRPIMYEAHHRVRVLNGKGEPGKFEVAGNICETGDILGHDRYLPEPKVGDYVALLDAGAYGFSMASEYNSFRLPAEILVRGGKEQVIRRRATFEDLLRNQVLLDDLS